MTVLCQGGITSELAIVHRSNRGRVRGAKMTLLRLFVAHGARNLPPRYTLAGHPSCHFATNNQILSTVLSPLASASKRDVFCGTYDRFDFLSGSPAVTSHLAQPVPYSPLTVYPFRSSLLETFPQPGRQGFFNICRATK
jgi:hypothetical protein